MFTFPLSRNSAGKQKETDQNKERKAEFKLKYFECRKAGEH